jgi:hypothetical protein
MSNQLRHIPSKFWMVKGSGPTNVIHDTREAAEREAGRLAAAGGGQWFYVLEVVSAYRSTNTTRFAFDGRDPDGGLPF